MKSQREFIHSYNKNNRSEFNESLFVRTDDELIEAMKDIIYSCERDAVFTIKVINFEVIDSYDDINHILWEYEDYIINKGKKIAETDASKTTKKKTSTHSAKKDNQFAYINLKRSDLKLIKVTYFIQINEKKNGLVNDTVVVYIAIPRIIDDFYFRLNGNLYSAMYQIVDASTYNNSAAKNAKKQSVTLKSVFMPIRVYKYATTLKDYTNEQVQCNYFVGNIFKKSILLMKYILANYGFKAACEFLMVDDIRLTNNVYENDLESNYVFPCAGKYIIAPKVLYNSNLVYQSFVYTIYSVVSFFKDCSVDVFYNSDIWLRALGLEFTSKDLDSICTKGRSILDSLNFIYDIATQKDMKLNEYDKADIFCIIRWMMYEFNALRQKDNMDISTKKVRWAEYIASLYAAKLATGIYRISDKGDKADLDTIRKAIQVPPMYLINAITKCQLVNYKNSVNDIDALLKLKYTYKGVSGIGEKSNAISSAYRSVHPSHLGRVDLDSSSNSDPGISGTIIPFVNLHDGHFDEYQEPSTWFNDITKLRDAYRNSVSKVEMCRIVDDLDLKTTNTNKREVISEATSVASNLMRFVNYGYELGNTLAGGFIDNEPFSMSLYNNLLEASNMYNEDEDMIITL